VAKTHPSLSTPCLVARARVARCGTAAPASLSADELQQLDRAAARGPVIAVGHPTDKALRLFFSRYPKKKVLRRRRRPVRGAR